MADPRDFELRQAALDHVRDLQRRYDDLVPITALREGFLYQGRRVSYGSFYDGIFRAKEMHGPAALTLNTTPPKVGRPAPYEDDFDRVTGRFTYRFRDPKRPTAAALAASERDNRALIAAYELTVPVIYFVGIFSGQYSVVAPAYVAAVEPDRRRVLLDAALPVADATPAGLVSDEPTRRYATREALVRLHQHRFRAAVLRAYSSRCAVCSLREAPLLQAAHIIEDREERGEATVVNGISLCAIHHLAYDRNLMGIAPDGVVHIAKRLLGEIDGPMLREGLQGFHGRPILLPKRVDERPDPTRLEVRFESFEAAS